MISATEIPTRLLIVHLYSFDFRFDLRIQKLLRLENQSLISPHVYFRQVHDKVLLQEGSVLGLWEKLFMVFEYLFDRGSFGWVLLQTITDEISEALIPLLCLGQLWGCTVDNREDDFHRRLVRVGSFTICQLDCCYSDWPNVCWVVMTCLLHYFRGHPTGRTYKSFPFLTFLQGGWHAEIADKDVAFHIKENVASLDITMNLLVFMEILQSKQCLT